MSTSSKSDSKQLESLIQTAVKKLGAKKENDICRYIPSSTGGYIHHFTMRKMKTEDPEQLTDMILKYIINVDKPSPVTPKQRAARGSRKRRDQILFSKQDIERMLNMARLAGDKEMIRKLTPKKDLRSIKRELIASIRHGKVEQDLWTSYVEAISLNNNLAASANSLAPQYS
ncbi:MULTISPECIES: hypothetical protein [unclassified Neochlamydia]|uniref:hypothetical protein n=1 Tax=unclassified Neochlamydia TaxID=2643326 RepID=UPI00140E4109|nr:MULTISPECIES: hypothetical protein [unclassified Neochlamydia]MBS4166869.1 Uncharacterized protein [Neochlamydia sp. AcF65]NGY94236.1 hypothetical protein [Neochlamydia sp. AcF84]